MKLFLRGLVIAATAIAITACSNSKNTIQSIEGTVTYLQRIALPPTAVLAVSLNDISSSNASTIIDTQEFKTEGKQVPISFTYKVPNDINTKKQYGLSAIIKDEMGQTLFTSAIPTPVLTDANKTSKVEMRLISDN